MRKCKQLRKRKGINALNCGCTAAALRLHCAQRRRAAEHTRAHQSTAQHSGKGKGTGKGKDQNEPESVTGGMIASRAERKALRRLTGFTASKTSSISPKVRP